MPSGGKREGAGRPKGAKNKNPAQGRKKIFDSVTISGTPEEVAQLKKLASEKDKSVSRFIIERCLDLE